MTDEQKNIQKMQQERLLQFKKSLQGMIATSRNVYDRNSSKYSRYRQIGYSRDEIDKIVECGTPIERAQLSRYFFEINGLYKRIILHYATFLTYSWILVPYLKNRKSLITDKKIAQTYYDASNFLTSFQVERKCSLFAKEVFVNGAYYGLINNYNDKIVIQDLPFDYCRSRFKNKDDIDIVEFNVKFFDDQIRDESLRKEILKTYPKVIQKAYSVYKYKDGPKWIFLPTEMGIYFSYFEERPFFLDLIPLLDDLKDYKEIDKKRKKQSLKRIIVQRVGLDGKDLIFEPNEAEEMHEGVVSMLENNPDVDVVTTYNEIKLLDLSGSDDEDTEIPEMQNLIYESAGMSKEFFFPTTEAGLAYSANNDLAMMMILGQRFAHFFTYLLNQRFENTKVYFKLIILPLSYYNSADYTSRARELASFGYSFLTPILSTGIDQTNLANLKMLENDLLNFDILLKPLQSSYTQSGKQAGEPMGTTPGSPNTDENNSDNNSNNSVDGGGRSNENDKQSESKQNTQQEVQE